MPNNLDFISKSWTVYILIGEFMKTRPSKHLDNVLWKTVKVYHILGIASGFESLTHSFFFWVNNGNQNWVHARLQLCWRTFFIKETLLANILTLLPNRI